MARNTDKVAPPKAVATDSASGVVSPTADDSAADDEPIKDVAPMNRADRRLEAKRKKGRNPAITAQPEGRDGPGQGMRGRGFQGGTGQTKGTNTRRSG